MIAVDHFMNWGHQMIAERDALRIEMETKDKIIEEKDRQILKLMREVEILQARVEGYSTSDFLSLTKE
jgi:phage host-nuclease inhibitor protein Gam